MNCWTVFDGSLVFVSLSRYQWVLALLCTSCQEEGQRGIDSESMFQRKLVSGSFQLRWLGFSDLPQTGHGWSERIRGRSTLWFGPKMFQKTSRWRWWFYGALIFLGNCKVCTWFVLVGWLLQGYCCYLFAQPSQQHRVSFDGRSRCLYRSLCFCVDMPVLYSWSISFKVLASDWQFRWSWM